MALLTRIYYVSSALSLLVLNVLCFKFDGKEFRTVKVLEDGVSKREVYLNSPNSKNDWIVTVLYNNSYLSTGWDSLHIETNPNCGETEETQVGLAGYLEGQLTSSAIYDHWYNTVRVACVNRTEVCAQIKKHVSTNLEWVGRMIFQHQNTDIYWSQVNLFYKQLAGVFYGYNSVASADKKLSMTDIFWLNFNFDFMELMTAFKNESFSSLKGNGHCSALIKVVHGQSDIVVAHNSWIGYETMRRIVKRYTFPLNGVFGSSMSFSSYPGAIISGDDFYIINTGLVALETTIENNNKSLYALIKPEGQVLEVVRVTVANRLAQGGRSWAKIFSRYNSGTYNNQWMIVDMNKFSPGSIRPELLWIIEQMPGYIRQEDQTDLLLREGYWASYNRPYYPDIFNMGGYQELVNKHGDYFSHDKTARALIFKRDQNKVVDVDTMMSLMRSNDFEHDPLSRCDCSPPYSSAQTIASRNELNLVNGTYPFSALGYSCDGAIDAKVTNSSLAQSLSLVVVSGPSTGSGLPVFQWSRSDCANMLSHRGHPDVFDFQPILVTWPQLIIPNDNSPSVQLIP